MVAFATGAYDREAYALKFFASREAFDKEVELQSGSAVGALVPPIRAVHDPHAPQAPGGWARGVSQPLPPCIVYCRGESLIQWLNRAETDVFQAVSVLKPLLVLEVILVADKDSMQAFGRLSDIAHPHLKGISPINHQQVPSKYSNFYKSCALGDHVVSLAFFFVFGLTEDVPSTPGPTGSRVD